jgi:hypothetical protein
MTIAGTNRPNRRRGDRIRLSESIVARLGTQAAVMIDISDFGARVEHYHRLRVGDRRVLRLEIGGTVTFLESRVASSKVHRFASGDDGLTVYRSGLEFIGDENENREAVRKLVKSVRAQTLVEQVANAKGFAPPTKGDMPIFRGGVLTTNELKITSSKKDEHLLPDRAIVKEAGFIRFSRKKGRWAKVWTLDPEQPDDGFTVSANEAADQVDMLCNLYRDGDKDTRQMIRLLAATSLEGRDK